MKLFIIFHCIYLTQLAWPNFWQARIWNVFALQGKSLSSYLWIQAQQQNPCTSNLPKRKSAEFQALRKVL